MSWRVGISAFQISDTSTTLLTSPSYYSFFFQLYNTVARHSMELNIWPDLELSRVDINVDHLRACNGIQIIYTYIQLVCTRNI